MPRALAGRTALVTGASRGIGREIARVLAAEGARVALVARSVDALRELADALGDHTLPLAGDLTRPAELSAVVAGFRAGLGEAPDILVNNAGAFAVAPVAETTADELRAMLDVNLVGPYALASAFLPAMRVRGSGHLVGIGSVADRHVFPGNAAYAPSKFAFRALHETMRLELRGSGVRVTLVSPGPVDTPIWDALDPDSREGFTPRSRMLTAAAVAEAVRWAVSVPPTVNVDELRLSRA